MTARRASFRQADIARAMKGARAAGQAVDKIEIDGSGKIVVIMAREGPKQPQETPLDEWRARRAAKAQGT